MSARHLVFGSLAAMLVLVGVMVFMATGDGAEGRTATADTPRQRPVMVAAPDDAPDSAATDHVDPDLEDDAGRAPATDAGDDGVAPSSPGVTPPASRQPAGPPPGAASPARPASEPAPSAASQDPDVEAILRETSRRYEGVRSLQADFRQEIVNPLLGTRVGSAGTLYQRQPDRFLMRFSDPAGDVIVSDGEFFWLYFPSTDERQVIRSRRGAEGLDLRSQFVGDPVRRFAATWEGREEVDGRTAHVLTLEPREALGYRRLKVWIDASDHLVRRFDLTEDNGLVRHFRLTDLRINPTLDDQLFRFSPPAGARVVDRG